MMVYPVIDYLLYIDYARLMFFVCFVNLDILDLVGLVGLVSLCPVLLPVFVPVYFADLVLL